LPSSLGFDELSQGAEFPKIRSGSRVVSVYEAIAWESGMKRTEYFQFIKAIWLFAAECGHPDLTRF
jgi:hypothetical protein